MGVNNNASNFDLSTPQKVMDAVQRGDITGAYGRLLLYGNPNYSANGPVPGQGVTNGGVAMGYGSAQNATPLSAVPSQGYNDLMASMMGSYASMYGADAAANGAIGAAEQNKLGVLGSSQNQLTGQLDSNAKTLEALLKQYDQALEQERVRQRGAVQVAGIGAGASNHASDNTLAGVKDTNAAGVSIAGIQQYDDNLKAQALAQYLGLGGTGNVTGPGGIGGSGPMTGTGSGGTTVSLGGDQQGGSYAPVVPAFQPFSEIMANKQKGEANSDIATQAATQARDYARSRTGAGGMSMRGGVNDQLGIYKMNALGNMTANNTKVDLGVPQYNAQNAATYANMGLQQYNAEQDRANRLQLAKTLNPGTIISALA